MKIDLNFEASDAIMVELLKDTYNAAVWGLFNNTHPDDIEHDYELMEAVTVLLKYYTFGDQADRITSEIYDKHFYRHYIGTMGDESINSD